MSDLDRELLRALRAKQPQALTQLYDRYGDLMFSLAVGFLGAPQEAEDVLQDIFLSLWQNCKYDPDRGSFKSFLMLLVRSRCLDRLRSRKANFKRQERSEQEVLQQHFRVPMDEAVSDEIAQRVKAALVSLPDNQRQALELAYFQGQTQAEIAERLQVPLGTVKSWFRLGFAKLRESLKEFIS